MKRNVSVVCVKFRCNILISGKIINEMPGSVASGTFCIIFKLQQSKYSIQLIILQCDCKDELSVHETIKVKIYS